MGLLVEGKWQDKWYDTAKDGRFQRESARRRNWITADGSPGPSGKGGFTAEPGRYHLYVSLACPWAHRTLIFRKLKGLESLIDVSVVSWLMLENGWTFDRSHGSSGDALGNLDYLYQRYTRDDAGYTGRVTVPLLWDTFEERIVSNESSEIIRMFNSAFDGLTNDRQDFYPPALRTEIDAPQRAHLSGHQQRRIPGGLRHHPGSLRGSLRRTVPRAGQARSATGRASLSGRSPPDRSRLETVHHADPLRRGHHGHFAT